MRRCTSTNSMSSGVVPRSTDVCACTQGLADVLLSAHGVDLSTLQHRPGDHQDVRSPSIMMDPPEHDRLRALVSRVLPNLLVGACSRRWCARSCTASYLAPFDDADVIRRGGRFQRAVPRRDHLTRMLWRSRGRTSADPPLARHRPSSGTGPDGSDTSEGMQAQDGRRPVLSTNWLRRPNARHPGDDMISQLTQVEVDRGDGTMTTRSDNKEIAGFCRPSRRMPARRR